MDPGNFATNIQAGAKYGYSLLWVVLLANVIAMLFQALSAKLGIVTGRNLAEMCRDHFPRPVVWAMWVVSEIAAMATDLAEFLGGAIGFSLLFHMPLLPAWRHRDRHLRLLMFEAYGFRPIELIIGAIVGMIGLCYLVEMFIAPVDWGRGGLHTVVPQIADAEALLLRGRHHRRDRDAARDLSAFRPDAGAHAGSRRHRAAQSAALLQPEVVIALAVAGLSTWRW
jgi:manganese transport protein